VFLGCRLLEVPSSPFLRKLSTKDKPNLKSNEPGQTHNETDGPTERDVDSEPAVQLIKDLFLKSLGQGIFFGSAPSYTLSVSTKGKRITKETKSKDVE
jgi:hypothetical protein